MYVQYTIHIPHLILQGMETKQVRRGGVMIMVIMMTMMVVMKRMCFSLESVEGTAGLEREVNIW